MRTDNSSSNVLIYIVIIAVIGLAIVGVHSGKINLSGLGKASVVDSVSTIPYAPNSGNVQNGQLYGAKMQFHATLTPDPLDTTIQLAQTGQTWGTYKVTPQDNLRIKMSSSGSAEGNTASYRLSYYKDSSNSDVQTMDLIGSGGWQVLTPIHIEIYADATPRPSTLVLSQDIAGSNIQGQQFFAIGNGVNIQRSSIALTGNTLPSDLSNFVVATQPVETAFQNANIAPNYRPGTYIFSKDSYAPAVTKFYNQAGTQGWFSSLQDSQLALWTGYDVFTWSLSSKCGRFSSAYTNGYCKLSNWNGLYQEATKTNYNVQYDSSRQKIVAPSTDYTASVNLEIPSDMVKSFAILRGVGVADVTYSMTSTIQQGNTIGLTVTVTNKGDDDGFNIWASSQSGKLLFTPASYSNQFIKAGDTQVFRFVFTVAGRSVSLPLSDSDNAIIDVQPVHGQKVEKTQPVAIGYTPVSTTQSDKTSQQQQQQGTFTSNNNVQQSNTNTQQAITNYDRLNDTTNSTYKGDTYEAKLGKWYNSPLAIILGLLVGALLIIAVASRRDR